MEKKRFLFDLDNTLLTSNYQQERDYFNSIYGEEGQYFIKNISSLLEEYERIFPRYNTVDLSNYLETRTELEITPEIIDGWIDIMATTDDKIESGVIETLEDLKQKDHSLVVLTNWFHASQVNRLQRSGLYEYFDEVYAGDLFLKPHRDSYLCARGSFSPQDCVVVGDNLNKDYIGPRAVGMGSILYDRDDKHHENIVKVKKIKDITKRY